MLILMILLQASNFIEIMKYVIKKLDDKRILFYDFFKFFCRLLMKLLILRNPLAMLKVTLN